MIIFSMGDVVGEGGCELVREKLPAFKRFRGVELCIANGENSAQGNGITPFSADHLIKSGVDIITTGNHVYRRKEIYDYLDSNDFIVRPANFHSANPGKGYCVVDMGRTRVAVLNLSGNSYMDQAENAFLCAERLLGETKGCGIRLVDFHAEATAEKRAMGFFLDGRVSALFGTHTHVQTADEQVLPGGTGYITDLGMTGPIQSVLGVTPSLAIGRFLNGMPVHFSNPNVPGRLEGCIFDIDERTGLCRSVERVGLE